MQPLIARRHIHRLAVLVGLALVYQAFLAGSHAPHDAAGHDHGCAICIQLDRSDSAVADLGPTLAAVPLATSVPSTPPESAPSVARPATRSRGPPIFS